MSDEANRTIIEVQVRPDKADRNALWTHLTSTGIGRRYQLWSSVPWVCPVVLLFVIGATCRPTAAASAGIVGLVVVAAHYTAALMSARLRSTGRDPDGSTLISFDTSGAMWTRPGTRTFVSWSRFDDVALVRGRLVLISHP